MLLSQPFCHKSHSSADVLLSTANISRQGPVQFESYLLSALTVSPMTGRQVSSFMPMMSNYSLFTNKRLFPKVPLPQVRNCQRTRSLPLILCGLIPQHLANSPSLKPLFTPFLALQCIPNFSAENPTRLRRFKRVIGSCHATYQFTLHRLCLSR